MINQVNSIHAGSQLYSSNKLSKASLEPSQNTGVQSAAVVELQSSISKSTELRQVQTVDASTADSLASDIASLLGQHGSRVQEHLNGFDAARLLAD